MPEVLIHLRKELGLGTITNDAVDILNKEQLKNLVKNFLVN